MAFVSGCLVGLIIGLISAWMILWHIRARRVWRGLRPLHHLGVITHPISPERSHNLIAELARNYLAKNGGTGLVIGTLVKGQSHLFSFGTTSIDGPDAPVEDAVFEIGSITKTFTATLLAQMHINRELDWNTRIEDVLPNIVRAAPAGQRSITLLDLATHSSGLPRLPPNLRPVDRHNPYAGYSLDHLYDYLKSVDTSRINIGTYKYSNLGFGLLGHLLSIAAGREYVDLIVERICAPLDMGSTRATTDVAISSRLAQPHNRWQKAVPVWENPTLSGAGCLVSSCGDMLRYLAAHFDDADEPLRKAMRHATRKQRPNGTPCVAVGLGWHVTSENAVDIVWHDGGTGGSCSFAGLLLEAQVGVAVLANSSSSVNMLAKDVLYLLFHT